MRKSLIAFATVISVLAFATVALATSQLVQNYKSTYTTKHPGKATGINTKISSSDPGDPNNKPAPARKVVVNFAKGTKFNQKAVKQCNGLTDTQVLGGACPAKSQIGTGVAEANAAPLVQGPVGETLKAYNTKGGILFAIRKTGAIGQDLVLHGKLKGTKLTTVVPDLTVLQTKVALTRFDLNIKKLGTKKKPYITSPKTCSGGKWKVTAVFTYDDGTKKTVKNTSPCKKK